MLTIEDCIALSTLTPQEVAAIAEHEHIPEIVAAEFGHYLLHDPKGEVRIARMIHDDIATARRRGDYRHSARLKLALKHFVETHHHRPAGSA
ncbi:MAG: hypothetical protein RLO50_18470 [Azospirillaceae bacterium]